MTGFVLSPAARDHIQVALLIGIFTVETAHGPIIGWWSAGCDLELAL